MSKPELSREEKVSRFCRVFPNGEHRVWFGRRSTSGIPVIKFKGRDVPASHWAFESRTGRAPVGIVKAECGVKDCLTPAHLGDEVERRSVRMQERALYGLDPQPWDVCPKGRHKWDEDGRLQPNLTDYCKSCNSERAARVRSSKRKDITS